MDKTDNNSLINSFLTKDEKINYFNKQNDPSYREQLESLNTTIIKKFSLMFEDIKKYFDKISPNDKKDETKDFFSKQKPENQETFRVRELVNEKTFIKKIDEQIQIQKETNNKIIELSRNLETLNKKIDQKSPIEKTNQTQQNIPSYQYGGFSAKTSTGRTLQEAGSDNKVLNFITRNASSMLTNLGMPDFTKIPSMIRSSIGDKLESDQKNVKILSKLIQQYENENNPYDKEKYKDSIKKFSGFPNKYSPKFLQDLVQQNYYKNEQESFLGRELNSNNDYYNKGLVSITDGSKSSEKDIFNLYKNTMKDQYASTQLKRKFSNKLDNIEYFEKNIFENFYENLLSDNIYSNFTNNIPNNPIRTEMFLESPTFGYNMLLENILKPKIETKQKSISSKVKNIVRKYNEKGIDIDLNLEKNIEQSKSYKKDSPILSLVLNLLLGTDNKDLQLEIIEFVNKKRDKLTEKDIIDFAKEKKVKPSHTFETGGFTHSEEEQVEANPLSANDGKNGMLSILHPDEYVIPKQLVEQNPELISSIEQERQQLYGVNNTSSNRGFFIGGSANVLAGILLGGFTGIGNTIAMNVLKNPKFLISLQPLFASIQALLPSLPKQNQKPYDSNFDSGQNTVESQTNAETDIPIGLYEPYTSLYRNQLTLPLNNRLPWQKQQEVTIPKTNQQENYIPKVKSQDVPVVPEITYPLAGEIGANIPLTQSQPISQTITESLVGTEALSDTIQNTQEQTNKQVNTNSLPKLLGAQIGAQGVINYVKHKNKPLDDSVIPNLSTITQQKLASSKSKLTNHNLNVENKDSDSLIGLVRLILKETLFTNAILNKLDKMIFEGNKINIESQEYTKELLEPLNKSLSRVDQTLLNQKEIMEQERKEKIEEDMEVGHAEIENDDEKIVNTSNRIMPVIIPSILNFLKGQALPLLGGFLLQVQAYFGLGWLFDKSRDLMQTENDKKEKEQEVANKITPETTSTEQLKEVIDQNKTGMFTEQVGTKGGYQTEEDYLKQKEQLNTNNIYSYNPNKTNLEYNGLKTDQNVPHIPLFSEFQASTNQLTKEQTVNAEFYQESILKYLNDVGQFDDDSNYSTEFKEKFQKIKNKTSYNQLDNNQKINMFALMKYLLGSDSDEKLQKDIERINKGVENPNKNYQLEGNFLGDVNTGQTQITPEILNTLIYDSTIQNNYNNGLLKYRMFQDSKNIAGGQFDTKSNFEQLLAIYNPEKQSGVYKAYAYDRLGIQPNTLEYDLNDILFIGPDNKIYHSKKTELQKLYDEIISKSDGDSLSTISSEILNYILKNEGIKLLDTSSISSVKNQIGSLTENELANISSKSDFNLTDLNNLTKDKMFKEGGYTSGTDTNKVQGVVHEGEYVIPNDILEKIKSVVGILEKVRTGDIENIFDDTNILKIFDIVSNSLNNISNLSDSLNKISDSDFSIESILDSIKLVKDTVTDFSQNVKDIQSKLDINIDDIGSLIGDIQGLLNIEINDISDVTSIIKDQQKLLNLNIEDVTKVTDIIEKSQELLNLDIKNISDVGELVKKGQEILGIDIKNIGDIVGNVQESLGINLNEISGMVQNVQKQLNINLEDVSGLIHNVQNQLNINIDNLSGVINNIGKSLSGTQQSGQQSAQQGGTLGQLSESKVQAQGGPWQIQGKLLLEKDWKNQPNEWLGGSKTYYEGKAENPIVEGLSRVSNIVSKFNPASWITNQLNLPNIVELFSNKSGKTIKEKTKNIWKGIQESPLLKTLQFFDDGGYTSDNEYQQDDVQGVVHEGEYVIPNKILKESKTLTNLLENVRTSKIKNIFDDKHIIENFEDIQNNIRNPKKNRSTVKDRNDEFTDTILDIFKDGGLDSEKDKFEKFQKLAFQNKKLPNIYEFANNRNLKDSESSNTVEKIFNILSKYLPKLDSSQLQNIGMEILDSIKNTDSEKIENNESNESNVKNSNMINIINGDKKVVSKKEDQKTKNTDKQFKLKKLTV